MLEPWEVDNSQWAPSAVTSPDAEPKLARSSPLPLRNQQPFLKAHPGPNALTQQAWEAPRNPGGIQSPDRSRKSALSSSPFLSTGLAPAWGWRPCSYFYPQISGIADQSWLQDTTVNSLCPQQSQNLSHSVQLRTAALILTPTPRPQGQSRVAGPTLESEEAGPSGCLRIDLQIQNNPNIKIHCIF